MLCPRPAVGGQAALATLLRQHRLQMIYYAAAPDGNGISPAYHVYRPAAVHEEFHDFPAVRPATCWCGDTWITISPVRCRCSATDEGVRSDTTAA